MELTNTLYEKQARAYDILPSNEELIVHTTDESIPVPNEIPDEELVGYCVAIGYTDRLHIPHGGVTAMVLFPGKGKMLVHVSKDVYVNFFAMREYHII